MTGTVRYLASGKPALVQDTGLSRNYPLGKGLVTFRTLDEAVAGAQQIAHNPSAHSRTARALALEYFDSDKVLTRLLGASGLKGQADMNQIETELALSDVDSDVEIETLMTRIREHTNGNENTVVAVVNAGGHSGNSILGEALASQAAFNRALSETMVRLCRELEEQGSRLDAQHAEIKIQHTLLGEQLLNLRSEFVEFTQEERLHRRDMLERLERESVRFAERLTASNSIPSARRRTQAQITSWFGALGSLSALLEANTRDAASFKQNLEQELDLLRIRVRRVERTHSAESGAEASHADGETAPTHSAPETSDPHSSPKPKTTGAGAAPARERQNPRQTV